MMKNNKKIIDKIYKCLRLSESLNPNEAAMALRQASSLMRKHSITDAQVLAAEVNEGATTQAGTRYNPPFWTLALANLVAEAFECRNLILRQYGKSPEYRFIGLGTKAEIATYSYTVLYRHLLSAIEEFKLSLEDSQECVGLEENRRTEVFAQAWLFSIGRTVSEFVGVNADKAIIDDYIEERYGETVEIEGNPTDTQSADYKDILSGMQAGHKVTLYRSVGLFAEQQLLKHEKAS